MKRFILIAAVLCLTGCAATYERPVTVAHQASIDLKASPVETLRVSKQLLLLDGYQITLADDAAGVISTAAKKTKLTPELVDCGTTMGIDYLKDNRTDTSLALNIVIAQNRLIVKTTIAGEYKPGAATQNIQLECVSRGVVEREWLDKITQSLK